MKIYQARGRDCFFYILRNWSKILIGAILIAIALGARTGINTYRSWDQKQADVDAARQQREEYLPIYEQSLANFNSNIANKETELAEYMQNLNEADFLRYDESSVGVASAELYFVSYDDEGLIKEIPAGLLDVFATTVTDNLDWDEVAEAGSADVDFLDQLFIISIDQESQRIMTLKTYGENEESAAAMMDEILEQVAVIQSGLESQVGGFDYSEISNVSDEGRFDEFLTIKNRVQNHYNEIAIALQAEYDGRDELEAPADEVFMPTKHQVVKSVIKHTVFGGICGCVIMVVLYYLFFYLNGKLHSTEELEYYSGTRAMTYAPKDKKRFILNSIIARKENSDLLYNQEDAVRRIASNIKKQFPDVSKVMITGIGTEQETESVKESLSAIKSIGVDFGSEKNILTDKEAFDHLDSYDAVILVEKMDKTRIQLLVKEIEQINISGKKVIATLIAR